MPSIWLNDAGWLQGRIKLIAFGDMRSVECYKAALKKVGEVWPGAILDVVKKEDIKPRPRAPDRKLPKIARRCPRSQKEPQIARRCPRSQEEAPDLKMPKNAMNSPDLNRKPQIARRCPRSQEDTPERNRYPRLQEDRRGPRRHTRS